MASWTGLVVVGACNQEAPGPRRSPNLFWHEIVDIASIGVGKDL